MSNHDSNLVVDSGMARAIARLAIPYFVDLEESEGDAEWELGKFSGVTYESLFNADPFDVFDVEGRLVFKVFADEIGEGVGVFVRVAGNKSFGAPIISIAVYEKQLELSALIDEARSYAVKIARDKGVRVEQESLVCYSYPRLGLLVSGSTGAVVVDIIRHVPVPLDKTWSLFAMVGEGKIDEKVEEWNASARALRAGAWNAFDDLQDVARRVQQNVRKYVLPGVPRFGQTGLTYCVPAVAAMILGFSHVCKTQSELGVLMKTQSNSSVILNGTTLQGELVGYQKAVPSFAIAKSQPAFGDAQQEIGAQGSMGLPFKAGLPGHAQVVRGWKTGVAGSSGLKVNDPWPPKTSTEKGGTSDWQTWFPNLHTDFIFVRPPK